MAEEHIHWQGHSLGYAQGHINNGELECHKRLWQEQQRVFDHLLELQIHVEE